MTDAFAASLIFRAIGWALIQSLWQGAIVGVVTACALLAFRRSAANHRYTVACLGLAALVVVPVVTAALHARELRTSGIRIDLAAPVFISPDGRPVAAPDFPPDAGSSRTSNAPAMRVTGRWPDERLEEWSLIAVPLWLIGVLALSSRLVGGWLAVERVRRAAARPVSEAWLSRVKTMADRLRVARPIRVVESAVVNSPMVVGWLRPVILLPASALTGLAPSQLEAVIAHELAHIRRHDYLVNLLQATVETFLFYHPASWWISRQIRVEREHCCDDMAVELCGDRLTYARALADLEQMRGADMKLALAASGGSLIRRIRRLLGVASTDPNHSPTWAVVCVVLTVLSLMVMREDVTSAQGSGGEGAIRGQVLDARSGLPLARATVHVSDLGPVASVTTDADGRYEAAGLKAGEYRLYVSAPGYVAAQYGQRQAAEEGTGVEVRGRQITSRVDVRLQPAAIISGRIFDDAGEPLAGVEIELLAKRYLPGGASPVAVGFAQTESSGFFRVGDLQEGEYLRTRLRAGCRAAFERRRDAGVRADIFSASTANRGSAADSCCRWPRALRREFRSRDGQEAPDHRNSRRSGRAALRPSESPYHDAPGGHVQRNRTSVLERELPDPKCCARRLHAQCGRRGRIHSLAVGDAPHQR